MGPRLNFWPRISSWGPLAAGACCAPQRAVTPPYPRLRFMATSVISWHQFQPRPSHSPQRETRPTQGKGNLSTFQFRHMLPLCWKLHYRPTPTNKRSRLDVTSGVWSPGKFFTRLTVLFSSSALSKINGRGCWNLWVIRIGHYLMFLSIKPAAPKIKIWCICLYRNSWLPGMRWIFTTKHKSTGSASRL